MVFGVCGCECMLACFALFPSFIYQSSIRKSVFVDNNSRNSESYKYYKNLDEWNYDATCFHV